MSHLAVVSPGHPAVPGGVTDHTTRLVEHWRASGHTVEVLGTTEVRVEDIVSRWVTKDTRAALIQYVPFLYGRRGLSRFPERLTWAATAVGIRVAIFVHEPWVPPTRLPWLVLSPLQQRQLRRVVRLASQVVTAVPAWASILGTDKVLYVGSNLGELSPGAVVGPPLESPVVFSPFASGLRWEWIVAAVTAIGAKPPLHVIGATLREATQHPIVGNWASGSWRWRGRLSAAQVLGELTRARLVLAPFVDGLTGRRTSVLAALSVGAPVLSTTGRLVDPFFSAGPITLASSRTQFVDAAVHEWQRDDDQMRRQEIVRWHGKHLTPAQLDAELLRVVLGGA